MKLLFTLVPTCRYHQLINYDGRQKKKGLTQLNLIGKFFFLSFKNHCALVQMLETLVLLKTVTK